MTIRLASALRLRFKGHLALFRSLAARSCALVIALSLVPFSAVAQSPTVAPDSGRILLPPRATTVPNVTTNAATAPSGYVWSAYDQVGVEVFGEEDWRINGRFNAAGDLNLPRLGACHPFG